MRYIWCLLWFSCACIQLSAQSNTDYEKIVATFDLDSFTVYAVHQGKLQPEKFIQYTMEDTSLFYGFSLLKVIPHEMYLEANISDKKNRKGRIKRNYVQTIENGCREQTFVTLDSSGYFFDKKGRPISETYQMMMQFFSSPNKNCHLKIQASPKGIITLNQPKDIQQQKEFIKRFIFAPHTLRIDVPFMGNKMKTNIFESPTADMYTFKVNYDLLHDSIPAYHFTIEVDSIQYPQWKKSVLIKKMHTTFRADDLAILHRAYELYYPGWLASCDIHIKIDMHPSGENFIPKQIHYWGEWKFPTKGKDIANILLQFK